MLQREKGLLQAVAQGRVSHGLQDRQRQGQLCLQSHGALPHLRRQKTRESCMWERPGEGRGGQMRGQVRGQVRGQGKGQREGKQGQVRDTVHEVG